MTNDGNWIYLALHTVDSLSAERFLWVKLSAIDGSMIIMKGSWLGGNFERPIRRFGSILSEDEKSWFVLMKRKLTAASSWSSGVIKMDVWLDPIYNQYINENNVNTVHELTSIALSKRDRTILYVAGNIDDGNKDRGIIFKLQEATGTSFN